MELVKILTWLTVATVCLGGWNEPYTIYESTYPIVNHWLYVDKSANKTHVLFTMKETAQSFFYYMAISANGEKTTPKRLSDLAAYLTGSNCASITGSHDGKHIFVLFNAGRLQEGLRSEIYFMESNSDGQFFTDPIIPRSNDIEDTQERRLAIIEHMKSNRIVITYHKDRYVVLTTRAPYSTVWSAERTFGNPQDPVYGHSMISYTDEDNRECISVAALYYSGNPSASRIVLFISNTNGATWDSYDCPLNSSTAYIHIDMAYSTKTRRLLFSPLASVQNSLGIVYQWKKNEVKVVAVFPVSSEARSPALEVCDIHGSSSIVYFVDIWDGNSSDRLLMLIPEDKPHTFERLVSPSVMSSNGDIRVHCSSPTLFATGIGNFTKIMGTTYTFPSLKQQHSS